MSPGRSNSEDLRGATQLLVTAVDEVSRVVEGMHQTIASGPPLLGRPLAVPVRLVTAPVYATIRAAAALLGRSADALLSQLADSLGSSIPGPEREAVVAALNGVLGEYLVATRNPLAIRSELRMNGEPLPLEKGQGRALATALAGGRRKLVVLVHGSSMSDGLWWRNGRCYGDLLERELGFSPVYSRYNSGLHISINGRVLSEQLERLVKTWPVPIDQLVILGYSMGGLVARSACRSAEMHGLSWRKRLTHLITLGAPHHGAPLEQGGSWLHLVLGWSSYTAPLARVPRVRSAGITDLRYGNVVFAHWRGRDRFKPGPDRRIPLPLPADVACFAIAGSTAHTPGGRLPGDGVVPIASALGRHTDPKRDLHFPRSRQLVVLGTNHLGLLDSSEVRAALLRWLSPGDPEASD